jgi:hypothetical protein
VSETTPLPEHLRWLVEVDYRTENGTVTIDHHTGNGDYTRRPMTALTHG